MHKQDIFVNPNELVFDAGVNFTVPTDASGNQLPLTAANVAAYEAAGFPSAYVDSHGQPTPFFAFNQFSGYAAVTPGVPTNGSACFPAVNTGTWLTLRSLQRITPGPAPGLHKPGAEQTSRHGPERLRGIRQ